MAASLLDQFYYRDEPFSLGATDVLGIATLVWLDSTINTGRSGTKPLADQVLWPGVVTMFYQEPLVVDASWLVDLGPNPSTVAWTDAPRAPQTISTLLVIGV